MFADLHDELMMVLRQPDARRCKSISDLATLSCSQAITAAVVSPFENAIHSAYKELVIEIVNADTKITKARRDHEINLKNGTRIVFITWREGCSNLRGMSLDAAIVV